MQHLPRRLHLAADLTGAHDDALAHPRALGRAPADPHDRLAALVTTAERGVLDLVVVGQRARAALTPLRPDLVGSRLVVVTVGTRQGAEAAGPIADVVRLRATDLENAGALRGSVRAAAERAHRDPDDVLALLDVQVVVGPDRGSAAERHVRLRRQDRTPRTSLTLVGTTHDVADGFTEGFDAGLVDGYMVEPALLEADLHGVVDGVVPLLQGTGVYPFAYERAQAEAPTQLRTSTRLAISA